MDIPAVRIPPRESALSAISLTLCLIAVILLTVVPSVGADDNKVVRVCIPFHMGKDGLINRLATTLDNHKPAKNTHTKVEGVELNNVEEIAEKVRISDKDRLSDETLARARQSRCDYVLVLYNPDLASARTYQPNVMYPEQQMTTSTVDPLMRKQDPDIYVVIKYRLFHIDSSDAAADGFVSDHEAAPQNAVVASALDMLANQVFTKVTK